MRIRLVYRVQPDGSDLRQSGMQVRDHAVARIRFPAAPAGQQRAGIRHRSSASPGPGMLDEHGRIHRAALQTPPVRQRVCDAPCPIRPSYSFGTKKFHYVNESIDPFSGHSTLVPLMRFAGDDMAGSEFQLNEAGVLGYWPAIAKLAGGGSVVVWITEDETPPEGIRYDPSALYGRLIDARGAPTGPVFRIGSVVAAGEDSGHSVTGLASGGFVVTWVENPLRGQGEDEVPVLMQVYSAAGTAVGPAVQVGLGDSTTDPVVAALADGSFVVVYQRDAVAGLNEREEDTTVTIGQRYSASGGAIGANFTVAATNLPDEDDNLAITALADGGFVVAWDRSVNNSPFDDVYARRFGQDSTPRGAEFRVDTNNSRNFTPSIAGLPDGGFVMTWILVTGDNFDVVARIYNAAGVAVGAEFRVNTFLADDQGGSTVISLAGGGFLVVWTSSEQEGEVTDGVYAQRFDADGGRIGRETRINETADELSRAYLRSVVQQDDGSLLFTWDRGFFNDATEALDIIARQVFLEDFTTPRPLIGTAGNNVLIGTGEGETLSGLAGNDVLFGLGGNDTLDGGDGSDTADYSGDRGDYRITVAGGSYTIADQRSGGDGIDSVRNVEFVRFNGGARIAIETTLAAAPAGAAPLAGEARANSFVTGRQENPAITALTGGGSVVAWVSDGQDGSGDGVYAQRYAADGTPAGSEFRVATTTASDQRAPSLTGLANGGFVVTWENRGAGAAGYDIYGQRYSAAGVPQGGEFVVNTTTAGAQIGSSSAGLDGGGFVIAWSSIAGATTDIFARRYQADGTAVGGEFAINSFTAGNQDAASVAALAGGGFVVTWQSDGQDGAGLGIYGQAYAANGTPAGGEFRVTVTTSGDQRTPAVTALDGGGFVVVWNGPAVMARLFAADGAPVGGEITVGDSASGMAVTALAGGGFVVGWSGFSGGTGTDGLNVFGRTFDAAGAATGGTFIVNETIAGSQRTGGPGSVVQLADGSVAFVWEGAGMGDASGIFVRRFEIGATESNVPSAGNDVVTGTGAGEIIDLRQGGSDTADGGGGSDGFSMGAALDNGDRLFGGAGDDDQVIVQGNYTGANAIVLSAQVFSGIETLAIQPGDDARFGDSSGALYSYDITLSDANVAAGATLIVNANRLRMGENVTFNGSAEANGAFKFYMGAGNDRLIGGAGTDEFYGRMGADTMTGGGGNDRFFYRSAAESTAASRDTITDFTLGDLIDLSFFDANTANGTGANDAFAFIGSAAFTAAGQLRATNTGGANWLIEGDIDGNGVADLIIAVTTTAGHAIVAGDFVL